MSKVRIKAPNADKIFDLWKKKQGKSLEKHYKVKKAVFSLDNITAAKYVKETEEHAIIYFRVKHQVKQSKESETKQGSIKDILKTDWYVFNKEVKKADYKGDDPYADYKTLKQVACPKCKGKGGDPCKKCKGGVVACKSCDGKGSMKCRDCNGEGGMKETVTIYDEEGNKNKKPLEVRCSRCFGNKSTACEDCGTSGKVTCKKCLGTGLIICSECETQGRLFEYKMMPVPYIEEQGEEGFLFSSTKTKFEDEIKKDLNQFLRNIKGIELKTGKDLDKDIVEGNLGYMTKDIKKAIKNAEKEGKKAAKSDEDELLYPIYVFPLVILNCETKKGKSYEVLSIGSEDGFRVFGEI